MAAERNVLSFSMTSENSSTAAEASPIESEKSAKTVHHRNHPHYHTHHYSIKHRK
ncbi:hypothetical protein M430DRAFT_232464 [Amorphotheca resinae ATCC 22711]|uniref:Uncharacterized protein n=1 Tax=Amorphotheca resinae ATCC 22711 TaxID=857342 RepID=A0A2T3B3W8_AMORE|nr:hypothetical protein M430DRAFT_232464 [Amorphotheca resinae ATCC 22711]PSS20326.1 hypothetical protein M430DRAFT_232464 [Amorphotheca resinae ATCC 22711]